jgi:hypothetical protein
MNIPATDGISELASSTELIKWTAKPRSVPAFEPCTELTVSPIAAGADAGQGERPQPDRWAPREGARVLVQPLSREWLAQGDLPHADKSG